MKYNVFEKQDGAKAPGENLILTTPAMKAATLLYRAVLNKQRQQILKLLDRNQQMTVTDIFQTLKILQPVASQQLGILRRAGLVKFRRHGRTALYSVDKEMLGKLESTAGLLNEKIFL